MRLLPPFSSGSFSSPIRPLATHPRVYRFFPVPRPQIYQVLTLIFFLSQTPNPSALAYATKARLLPVPPSDYLSTTHPYRTSDGTNHYFQDL